jgi:hypothetical protein
VINSGPKGPSAADLAGARLGPSVFIDDLLPQLDSVADSAPTWALPDGGRRAPAPLAPSDPERHARIDLWPDLKTAIERKLFP